MLIQYLTYYFVILIVRLPVEERTVLGVQPFAECVDCEQCPKQRGVVQKRGVGIWLGGQVITVYQLQNVEELKSAMYL